MNHKFYPLVVNLWCLAVHNPNWWTHSPRLWCGPSSASPPNAFGLCIRSEAASGHLGQPPWGTLPLHGSQWDQTERTALLSSPLTLSPWLTVASSPLTLPLLSVFSFCPANPLKAAPTALCSDPIRMLLAPLSWLCASGLFVTDSLLCGPKLTNRIVRPEGGVITCSSASPGPWLIGDLGEGQDHFIGMMGGGCKLARKGKPDDEGGRREGCEREDGECRRVEEGGRLLWELRPPKSVQ